MIKDSTPVHQPPMAQKIPKELQTHGDIRTDSYFWMNERDNPAVTAFLQAENSYVDAMMQDTETLQEKLFAEMKARYREDDSSLPYFFNKYWYIVRYEQGREHPLFTRKYLSLEAAEELLLDANIPAQHHEFFEVGSLAVSPNNKLMSYSTDVLGRRIYTVYFKDLETGELLQDQIANTTGKVVWANDNEHVYYIRKDDNLRAFQVYLHQLGTDSSQDVLVFHEEDEAFDVNVFKTKSLEYIFIASSSTVSDEHRFIPASDVFAPWTVIQPRMEDLEYAVEHYQDQFYIITNEVLSIGKILCRTAKKFCWKVLKYLRIIWFWRNAAKGYCISALPIMRRKLCFTFLSRIPHIQRTLA